MLHLCPNPARQHATLPDHQFLQDPSLSPTAVGLLTKLMNAPANTSIDPKALALRCGTSRRVVKIALRELRAAGLLLTTTVRRPSGHAVTLICDDPDMLFAELARLNAGGWLDLTASPVVVPIAETRAHDPRHARSATEGAHSQRNGLGGRIRENGRAEHACHGVGEHGEHYHQCVLRTTRTYITSHVDGDAAGLHASAELACTTQDG